MPDLGPLQSKWGDSRYTWETQVDVYTHGDGRQQTVKPPVQVLKTAKG